MGHQVLTEFNFWLNENFLCESIKDGKIYIEKKGISSEDKNYKSILKLIEKTPGYFLPFLKFSIEQGIPIKGPNTEEINSLTALLKWLEKRSNLISRLPRSIQEYSSRETIDGVSGFEKMADDIRTLERNLSLKWFIERLPPRPRNEFRNKTFSEQQKIYNLVQSLVELDKGDPTTPIRNRLFDKIAAMSYYSIDTIADYIENYVQSYSNIDLASKIEKVRQLSPEAGILYDKFPYLALSVRTEKAQRDLCSVANWCINRGSFYTYAASALQYNIFNYSLPPSEPLFLTGTTVKYNGQVTHSHDLNDLNLIRTPRLNLKIHLLDLGYPRELAETLENSISNEASIKKLLEVFKDTFYGKPGSKGKNYDKDIDGFFMILLSETDKHLSGLYSRDEWEMVLEIVNQILMSSGGVSERNWIDFFSEYGVFNLQSLYVYNQFIKPKINKTQINKIYESTQEFFQSLENLVRLKGDQALNGKGPRMLEKKQEILSGIR